MNTLYGQLPTVSSENVTEPLLRTLQLLHSLSRRHGYAWATNAWLAAKLDYTVRTIQRHVKQLANTGYIATARRANQRHIRILMQPPDPAKTKHTVTISTPKCHPADPPKCHPATTTTFLTENTNSSPPPTAADPVVKQLAAAGIALPVAITLAAQDPDSCKKQLTAIRTGRPKGIHNLPAWLVSAIRNQWEHSHSRNTTSSRRIAEPNRDLNEIKRSNAEEDQVLLNALSNADREQLQQRVRATIPPILHKNRPIIDAYCIKFLTSQQISPTEIITAASQPCAT